MTFIYLFNIFYQIDEEFLYKNSNITIYFWNWEWKWLLKYFWAQIKMITWKFDIHNFCEKRYSGELDKSFVHVHENKIDFETSYAIT